MLIELVIGHQFVVNVQLVQQNHGASGILCGNDVHLRQHLNATGRHILRVANRGGNDI